MSRSIFTWERRSPVSWCHGTPREILPGLTVPLVGKEDAIVSKLLWIQQGSHKARHDVKMMLSRDEDLVRADLTDGAGTLGLRML